LCFCFGPRTLPAHLLLGQIYRPLSALQHRLGGRLDRLKAEKDVREELVGERKRIVPYDDAKACDLITGTQDLDDLALPRRWPTKAARSMTCPTKTSP
jgi:hypothetical protein